MASIADLERPVPALRLQDADVHAVIAELARTAGMQIAVDPAVARAYDDQKVTLLLTDATIADVLKAIPPPDDDPSFKMVLVRRDDGFVLHSQTELSAGMSVRMYDIGRFLPTTPPPPPSPAEVANLCFYNPAAYTPEQALRDDRLWTAEGIAQGSAHLVLQHTQIDPSQVPYFNGLGGLYIELCLPFNNHLIVVAPEFAQPIVGEFIRTLKEQPE